MPFAKELELLNTNLPEWFEFMANENNCNVKSKSK